MRLPTVSIGLPVYNGEKYLKGTLDSLLEQDYEDFELIISDNASHDQTTEICRAFSAKDRRIRCYQSESNRGAMWNFRRVFELARGKYFKWAAYDDECYPSMLRRCVETLEQAPSSVVLVYPRAEIINDCGQVVGSPKDDPASGAERPHQRLRHLLRHFHLGHAFYGLIRSEILGQTRGCTHIAADLVMLSELAIRGEIREIPEVLFRLRQHSATSTHLNKTRREREAWFNPDIGDRLLILSYRAAITLEYLKAVHTAHLSPVDRGLCFMTVLALYFRNAAGEQKERLRNMLRLKV